MLRVDSKCVVPFDPYHSPGAPHATVDNHPAAGWTHLKSAGSGAFVAEFHSALTGSGRLRSSYVLTHVIP